MMVLIFNLKMIPADSLLYLCSTEKTQCLWLAFNFYAYHRLVILACDFTARADLHVLYVASRLPGLLQQSAQPHGHRAAPPAVSRAPHRSHLRGQGLSESTTAELHPGSG